VHIEVLVEVGNGATCFGVVVRDETDAGGRTIADMTVLADAREGGM
jgi:hypothetical protein